MDIFGRLREERARLGLTQQQVADAVSVHIKTVRRWESRVAMPLDALIALLGIGYDVQYIACGVRSMNLHEVRESRGRYIIEPDIAGDVFALLRRYGALSPPQRAQARALIAVLARTPPAAKPARVGGIAAPRRGRSRSRPPDSG